MTSRDNSQKKIAPSRIMTVNIIKNRVKEQANREQEAAKEKVENNNNQDILSEATRAELVTSADL